MFAKNGRTGSGINRKDLEKEKPNQELRKHEMNNQCIFCNQKFKNWHELVKHYKDKNHMPYRNHDKIEFGAG